MWWRHPSLALALDANLKAEGNKETGLSAAPGVCPTTLLPPIMGSLSALMPGASSKHELSVPCLDVSEQGCQLD